MQNVELNIVDIENLSFRYSDGRQALNHIALVVPKGQTVALIGPNGAGKSTLLLHLNGILRGNGIVRVCGLVVEDKNLKEIRSRVGLVFQNPDDQLFSSTVFDDVAFGPINLGFSKEEVKQKVAQALSWVGMEGYEARSPYHLSIGEKKRIAIATVLSMNPEILVLDEPTSNLDPKSKGVLIELLQGLPLTKIIASHDLEAVRILCQRVVVLDEGQVIADGDPDRILGDFSLLEEHGLAWRGHAVLARGIF